MIIKNDIPTCIIQLRMKHEKSKSFTIEMSNISLQELYNIFVDSASRLWRKKNAK